jgi:hypothetical protein
MNDAPNPNHLKRDKRYGPTFESFMPDLFVTLLGLLPAVLSWESYIRTSNVVALVLAIVFSLVGFSFLVSSLLVLNTSAWVNDENLIVRSIGGKRQIDWQEVGSIRIVEKDRNYMPPYRTTRMVQISHSLLAQRVVVLHTSAWPKANEAEFLDALTKVAVQHGILINQVTTNI